MSFKALTVKKATAVEKPTGATMCHPALATAPPPIGLMEIQYPFPFLS